MTEKQKKAPNGTRLCDTKDCELPATHFLVWAGPMYCCIIHANGLLNLGEVMGFPTPSLTVRPLSPDEMYVGVDNQGATDND